MKGQKLLLLFAITAMVSCMAKSKNPKNMRHPDAGFKYQTFFNMVQKTTPPTAKTLEQAKNSPNGFRYNISRMYEIMDTGPQPTNMRRENYMLISDAYTYVDNQLDQLEEVSIPPKFKGGDEKKFSKWILRNNDFNIHQNSRLNDAMRGHLIMDITININGNIVEVNPLLFEDQYQNGAIARSFVKTVKKSPKWKPAMHDGKAVPARYLIAVVWGHWRAPSSTAVTDDRGVTWSEETGSGWSYNKEQLIDYMRAINGKDDEYYYDPKTGNHYLRVDEYDYDPRTGQYYLREE